MVEQVATHLRIWVSHGLVAVVGLVVGTACVERAEIIARERPTAGGSGGAESRGGAGGAVSSAAGTGGEDGVIDEVQRPRFLAPSAVAELNDPVAKDQDPTLTEDLCEILFFSDRGGNDDIWTARRDNPDDPWAPPTAVEELNSSDREQSPAISRDGLRLWYHSSRDPAGIWQTSRATREDAWDEPVPLPIEDIEPAGVVVAPTVDLLELRMAVSLGTGDSRDVYELVRPSWAGPWSDPAPVTGLNQEGASDSAPFFIDEGRELLFFSGRTGLGDLYWAYRETLAAPVTRVEALTELNAPDSFEAHPHLSVDRRVIYFGSNRTGNADIYRAAAR